MAGAAHTTCGPPSVSPPGISRTALLATRVMGPANDKEAEENSLKTNSLSATPTTSTERKIYSPLQNNGDTTNESSLSAEKTPLVQRTADNFPLADIQTSKAKPWLSDINQAPLSNDLTSPIDSKTESTEHSTTDDKGAIVQDGRMSQSVVIKLHVGRRTSDVACCMLHVAGCRSQAVRTCWARAHVSVDGIARVAPERYLPPHVRRCMSPHFACCVSHFACGMSHVACRMLHVASCMSRVARRMSHVACRMPHVARRMPHVACCMSHVACRTLHHRGEKKDPPLGSSVTLLLTLDGAAPLGALGGAPGGGTQWSVFQQPNPCPRLNPLPPRVAQAEQDRPTARAPPRT